MRGDGDFALFAAKRQRRSLCWIKPGATDFVSRNRVVNGQVGCEGRLEAHVDELSVGGSGIGGSGINSGSSSRFEWPELERRRGRHGGGFVARC